MKRKAWIVMLTAFLAGISLAWVQNKIPPVILTLMETFEISMATAGWLSSIFSIMAIITAIPAAYILNKLGPKYCGLIALGCAILGSFMGAFSSTLTTLFMSRIIEGLGLGVIAVVAPALISMWFPPKKRGLPMGIWGAWQMVAQSATFFLGEYLTLNYGWQGMWWFGVSLCVLSFILYGLKVASPPGELNYADVETVDVSIWEGFKSPSVWLLAGAAFSFCVACFGWCTWTAPFWSETFGWDIGVSNQYVGYIYMLEIPIVALIGWFLDRVTNRKRVGVIVTLFYSIILFISFRMQSPQFILVFVILYPILEGAIPTVLWTITPQAVKKPELAGIALAVLVMGMNLGMVFGPPITGAVVEAYGWAAGTIPITIASLLSMALMAKAKIYVHTNTNG